MIASRAGQLIMFETCAWLSEANRAVKSGDVVVTLPAVPVSSTFVTSKTDCRAADDPSSSLFLLFHTVVRLHFFDTITGKKRRNSRITRNTNGHESVIDLDINGLKNFDPEFYKIYYKDLTDITDIETLKDHFLRHGIREGRFRNSQEYIHYLETRLGKIPKDFEPDAYRSMNKDLSMFIEDYQLRAHYLQHGRTEKRKYISDFCEYEIEYKNYICKNQENYPIPAQTFRCLLKAHGITSAAWISQFNLGEFRLLNEEWLPTDVRSRMEALCLFVRHGIDRCAPISLYSRFDPDFHRQISSYRNRIERSDPYLDFINVGIVLGEAGNEDAFLLDLIGESQFPTCFDVDAYRESAGHLADRPPEGRALALAHYLRVGFPAGIRGVVSGEGSALLYEQIGKYHLILGQFAAALEALDCTIALDPTLASARHTRGDVLKALGREREAVPDFLFAAAQPCASVWSHIHATEGLAFTLGEYDAAQTQLSASASLWHGSASWRAMAHRVIAASHSATELRVHELYLEGRKTEADTRLTASLVQMTNLIKEVDPLPSPLPLPADGPIVIVANRDLAQCDHYRVTQKHRLLIRGGWHAEVYDQNDANGFLPALNRAKAVIFYRVPAHPAIVHAILYARSLGIQTIYEIDDLIFDPEHYPDPYESFEGQIAPETYAELQRGVPLFRHAMELCDVGLASTPALAEAIRPLVLTKTCHVLRNGLDDRNTIHPDTPLIPLARGQVTIFYGSGTKAHNQDFTDLAAPALLTALERHPHVRLIIAGHLTLDARFEPLAERVHRLDFSADLDAYWEVLSGVDINLAVLAESATTDAKSEIKWLEAAVCSVPSIVSATRTYREILVDGEDALLVRTPEAWSTALERLIVDPDLRANIGRRAREKALAQYSSDVSVRTLGSFLPAPVVEAGFGSSEAGDTKPHAMETPPGTTTSSSIRMRLKIGPVWPEDHALVSRCHAKRGTPDATASRRPRILLVNVYFPPQTIGGATRVMRDNVDYMIDQGDMDLAIVTSDVGVETPYRTRIDAYRGIPVYRIAVRRMAQMDWIPFDPKILHPFEEFLDRFDPDLVHFHCIQQLTATVVEAVRRRRTPYVVTLHDAWWISDFQFLIDADHQVQHPRPDPVTSGSDTRLGLTRSIARRRKLGRLLDDAHARLAVSEAFAQLYRDAGVLDVRTVANGISTLPPAPRPLRTSARVRLGHIGNRSAHKGACLLEVVLRTTRFDNLDLTIVEHGRDAGYSREEVWGTTPVRIIGPVPQTDISQLYAKLDVLLAPSIWPESYGLVTREAKASGLWVIASNLGAIGEDIDEGVDGFRIDVSSPEGLRSVLRRVDAAPDLYEASPPPSKRPVRHSNDQGADLLNIYRELHHPIRIDRAMGSAAPP